ncbi:hypothetical protein Tco_0643483, partial [Tanacetum coccineum]
VIMKLEGEQTLVEEMYARTLGGTTSCVFLPVVNFVVMSLQAAKKISRSTRLLRVRTLMSVISYIDFFFTGVQCHNAVLDHASVSVTRIADLFAASSCDISSHALILDLKRISRKKS